MRSEALHAWDVGVRRRVHCHRGPHLPNTRVGRVRRRLHHMGAAAKARLQNSTWGGRVASVNFFRQASLLSVQLKALSHVILILLLVLVLERELQRLVFKELSLPHRVLLDLLHLRGIAMLDLHLLHANLLIDSRIERLLLTLGLHAHLVSLCLHLLVQRRRPSLELIIEASYVTLLLALHGLWVWDV